MQYVTLASGEGAWFVAGDRGVLLKTTTVTGPWRVLSSGTTNTLYGMHFLGASLGYAT
jgi:hypothetical protein